MERLFCAPRFVVEMLVVYSLVIFGDLKIARLSFVFVLAYIYLNEFNFFCSRVLFALLPLLYIMVAI